MTTGDRLRRGYDVAANRLLSAANANGSWTGELSSSPLSTATAVAALLLVSRHEPQRTMEFEPLITRGLKWLSECQNADGGWGDTILSHSNISTTALAYATFHLADAIEDYQPYRPVAARAKEYFDRHGGFDAIKQRYGRDHTFSVPILTQCALAGLISWEEMPPLPFELGCFPHWVYRWVTLPVVSYALPALIAIGQVRHHLAPSRNPMIRWIRNAAIRPTLKRLQSIQPESGGFLEATPLTSFVTMSLASMGQSDHPVVRLGVRFLEESIRPDGSWPIDTNLATWVTTLSVNALRPETLPVSQANAIVDFLVKQQHRTVHRYTNADPGGWAWTDLSGGVPDADDTPGAILALLRIHSSDPAVAESLAAAVKWLLDLQNRDGGWPTFCRGWGALPFDRSAPDLTAHALRALDAWQNSRVLSGGAAGVAPAELKRRIGPAIKAGFRYLAKTQRPDGSWVPLWFGNQFAPDDENPVYGTCRVLAAFRDLGRIFDNESKKALGWLAHVQNSDGGWGGAENTPSSTEETALATEILLAAPEYQEQSARGLDWLLDRVESGDFVKPAPIGLYFAKLWYFEQLYPIIFAVSTLGRAIEPGERRVDGNSGSMANQPVLSAAAKTAN